MSHVISRKFNRIFWLVLMFVVGGAGVLFILPSVWLRVFLGVALLIVFSWIVRAGRQLEVNTLALITAYLLSVAQFGLHFFFRWPSWIILITVFIWVTTLFWLGFRLKLGSYTVSSKILSLVAGLSAAEIALALVFWPTHFLVSSTVFFLLFYLAWMVSHFYISGLLNRHRILIHVVFTAVILFIVLGTAQWTI